MALSVIAVSISVSPFFMAELATDMLTTSAPSRLPASSKLVWVRVLLSKNRLIWVRPLSSCSFLSACRFRATKPSARSSRSWISKAWRPSIPSRCLCRKTGLESSVCMPP